MAVVPGPDMDRVTQQEGAPMAAPMALLGDGVPLSLLFDLVLGPDSERLLAEERTVPARPDSPTPAGGASPRPA